MKNVNYKLLFFILSISFSLMGNAQNSYLKGWESFLNNKGNEARDHFTKALNDEKTKSEAYLSLALLDSYEGKEEQAFGNWSKFYDETPKSNALLYTSSHMSFAFSSRNVLKDYKLAFLEQLEKSSSINGYLKAVINMNLGYHYFGLNQLDKAKEYFRSTGVLYDWQVLGKFDNTSGGGFNKNWGALEKVKDNNKFTNIVGADVTWYYPGENKMDGWYYHDYYMHSGNSIVFAQNFVNSNEAKDVTLSIGVSGSLKAWVNDALVLSVEDERNCGIDLYAAKIKLNKGANRILLQLGAGEVSSSNFYARFIDDEGFPIEGLTHTHEYSDYKKDNTRRAYAMLEFYPEARLKELISGDRDNLLYQIMLAEQYLAADKTDEAIELLSSLQEKYPNSSLLHQKLSEGYMRAQNQTYATREMESIMTNDPDSFIGLVMLTAIAQESDKIAEVKKLLEKTINLYGKSDYSVGVEQWVASRENDSQKRIALAQEQYKKHPENYSMMNSLYQITEHTLKDSKAAKQIVEDYYNRYHNENVIQTLASIYMKEGESDKALKLYEERLDKLPYASGYYLNYASTLLSMQRYDKALEIANKLAKLTPYESSVYFLTANIYKEKGDKEKAIVNYEKALYYFPGHFDAIRQLRLLDQKKELEDYFPKNNLDSLIAKAGTAADYPEDNSIIVLLTEDILYHEKGANESHVEIAVKILNQAGIDAWKEYMLSTYSGQNLTLDKAEIIKANGQKVRAESSGGHIVFTRLEIGDVLHLDYRIKTYYYGKLSQMFFGSNVFQYMLPTMHVRYSIATPHDLKFEYKFVNGDMKPVIGKKFDRTLYTWELNNQSSIKEEPYMPFLQDVAPTLFYSNYPDWKYVREWYQDVTTNKFKSDYLLKKTVAQILKGKENVSDLEKAKLFYEYILKNTSYLNAAFMQDNHIPQKASRTLSTRMGDCKDVATLFTTMCREVGIDANVVLVLTRNNADNTLLLPSIAFNHAIAELNVDGKRYFLELTSNQLPFGSLFEVLVESKVLSIKQPSSGKTDALESLQMPESNPNKVERHSKIDFDGNGFKVNITNANYGSRGAYLRDYYANIGIEEQTKSMNELAAVDYRTNTVVSNLKFENLDNLVDSVVYTFDLVANNMIQEIAGMKVFRVVWTDNLGTLEDISLEKRKYPFLSWAYESGHHTKQTISVTIPEGMNLVEIPEDIRLECSIAKYSLHYDTSEAGVFKITREFVPKKGFVTVEEYPEFTKFMRSVSQSDEKQYVVK